jgi:4Fe-4S ferredoxin
MRGNIIKTENRKELTLKRSFLKRNYVLSLNKSLCSGCGLCATICPKEAINVTPAETAEGRLIKKPTIAFDLNACILCGECTVLCPLNALRMEVDGENISVVVKNGAFPVLTKEIKVDVEKCDPECGLVCQTECPSEAIKISAESLENGEIVEINEVHVDESLCFYCERCQLVCPRDAIDVKKPFQGKFELNSSLCPSGCMVCVDVCPTKAIQLENGKPVVLPHFCVFCSACQNICPKEAINVTRDWVFHSDIEAAAWLTALKKFASFETVMKELRVKSGRKRTSLVRNRTMHTLSKPEPPINAQAIAFLALLEEYESSVGTTPKSRR